MVLHMVHAQEQFQKGKTETKLISVVVPIYNAEDHLEQCLSSLLSQTYDSFEIICINDGSTDSTRELLESIASRDERVRSFHFDHAGLSAARNRGIDLARGSYVTFVDADDFVSPYYLSSLLDAMEGKENRFVKGLPITNSRNRLSNVQWERPRSTRTLSISEAIDEVLGNKVPESAWACLLPRESYQTIRFPDNKLHEDTSTVLDLIALFDDVVVVEQPIYAYVVRPGSIMNASFVNLSQILDYFAAVDTMQDFVLERYPEKADLLLWKTMLCYVRCYSLLDLVDPNCLIADELKATLRKFAYDAFPDLVAASQRHSLSKLQLARFALFAISPLAEHRALTLYKSLRNKCI